MKKDFKKYIDNQFYFRLKVFCPLLIRITKEIINEEFVKNEGYI